MSRQDLVKTHGATLSAVASLATSQTALAANQYRLGVYAYNTDANACYLKFGATATTTSFTVKIASDGFWEMPTNVIDTGIMDVICAADGAGSLYLTELS